MNQLRGPVAGPTHTPDELPPAEAVRLQVHQLIDRVSQEHRLIVGDGPTADYIAYLTAGGSIGELRATIAERSNPETAFSALEDISRLC